jgi:guanylate kinase
MFAFLVFHTTRLPHPGEVDGMHYNFVNRAFMVNAVSSGMFFVEHAKVHGNMYGTSFRSMFLGGGGGGGASQGDNNSGGGDNRFVGVGTGMTWICGPLLLSSTSSLSYDVNSHNDSKVDRHPGRAERQCLLDIDIVGCAASRSSRQDNDVCKGRWRGQGRGGGDGSLILGKGRSTSQYNFPRGSTQKMVDGTMDADGMLLLPDLDARFVFIALPLIDALRKQLTKCRTESLEGQLHNVRVELKYGTMPGAFDAIVINDDLNRACANFERTVKALYIGG